MDDIPTLRMLASSYDEINVRCLDLVERINVSGMMRVQIITGESAVGGGCLPAQTLQTPLIALDHEELNAENIADKLRNFEPPIITRIERGRVLIDLRTVSIDEDAQLAAAISHFASQSLA